MNRVENDTQIIGAIGIAGEFGQSTGEALNPRATRLKTSPSPTDRKQEGVRLLLHGAKYPPNKDGKKQQAVIDFLCDRKDPEKRNHIPEVRPRDKADGDGDDDEEDPLPNDRQETDDGEGGKLKFLSYEDVEGTQVLSLEWTTKYACEDSSAGGGGGDKSSSGHWGFFTWFIIMYVFFPPSLQKQYEPRTVRRRSTF